MTYILPSCPLVTFCKTFLQLFLFKKKKGNNFSIKNISLLSVSLFGTSSNSTFSSVVFSLNLSFPFGFFFSIFLFFLVFYSFLLAWHFHLLLSNYLRCISTLLLFLRLLFYQLRNSLLFLHFRRHLFLVTSDLCAPFPVFMTVPFPSHLPISIGHNSYPGGDPIRTSRRHLILLNTTDRRHACFDLFLFHYRQILKFVREKTRKIKVEREKNERVVPSRPS